MIVFPLIVALLGAAVLVIALVAAVRRPLSPSVAARAKPWWKSKTLWVNIGSVIGAGIAVAESLNVGSSLPEWATPLWLIALAMVNAALRLVTTRAVTLTDPPDRSL